MVTSILAYCPTFSASVLRLLINEANCAVQFETHMQISSVICRLPGPQWRPLNLLDLGLSRSLRASSLASSLPPQ